MRRNAPLVLATLVLLAAVVLDFRDCWAEKAYVTDAHEIAFRSGPSSKDRVLRMLQPGTGVEVLSTRNDWSRIRFSEGSEEPRVGWVLSKYLITQSPEETQAKGLEMENASLKEAIKGLEREKAEFAKREKELQEKISKVESSYEALRSGSANYLKFKDEFDQTRAALASVQATNQALIQENENLKLSQNIKWFIAGAVVLIGGWWVGMITGRLQRRRRPQYR